MGKIQKWGFGMAPLQTRTEQNYRNSIVAVKNFVGGIGTIDLANIINDISHVKGIFNRVIKQDQWDWFTVVSVGRF